MKKTVVPVVSEVELVQPVNESSPIRRLPRIKIILVVVAAIAAIYYFKGLFIVSLINNRPIWRLSVIKQLEKQGGKEVLENLIAESLVVQEAKKLKISVADSEIQAEISKIETQVKGNGQDLDTLLLAQNMRRSDLEGQIKTQKLIEKVLADKLSVSDAEITQYIADNEKSFPAEMDESEKRQQVLNQIKQQKFNTEISAWLATAKSNAKIFNFVSY